MKRIVVSSIFRLKEVPNEDGEVGRVYVLDWDSKTLLAEPKGLQPGYSLKKPLGKSHGARGVAIHEGRIIVAGSGNKFSIFDIDSYQLIDTIELPFIAYTHQIKSRGGLLWVVSTGNDKIFALRGWDIEEERDISELSDILTPHIVGGRVNFAWGEDKSHVNSIGWDENGDEYHVYLGANMLFNYSKKEIVYKGGLLDGPHDVVFHGSDIIVNSTLSGKTVAINKHTKEARVIYSIEGEINPGVENNLGATRALYVNGDMLFVGNVPTVLTQLQRDDTGDYFVVDKMEISRTSYEAIYDIVFYPVDWNE